SIQITGNQTIVAKFVEVGDPTYEGVHIPTAFSPNSDANHDWWFVFAGSNVSGINIKVYDRWGQLMFNTSDADEGWDGTYNGQPVNTGVYTYLVDATYDSGVTERLSGNITLIR